MDQTANVNRGFDKVTTCNLTEQERKLLGRTCRSMNCKPCSDYRESTIKDRIMDKYARFQILKYFKFDHLPTHLKEVSKPFHDLAYATVDRFVDGEAKDPAETTVAVRKLLEAKDAAVRAMI